MKSLTLSNSHWDIGVIFICLCVAREKKARSNQNQCLGHPPTTHKNPVTYALFKPIWGYQQMHSPQYIPTSLQIKP